jgi:hypothetical protein
MTEKCICILVGKPEGKSACVKPTHRWEDIKIYLGKLWCNDVNWICLAQNSPVVGLCEHCDEPSGLIKAKNTFQFLNDCQLLRKSL